MAPAQSKLGRGFLRRSHPRFQHADAAAADRNHVMLRAGHLHQVVVAGTLVTDDAVEIDDVTAMDADEPRLVEARLDVADGERTKQLVVAVEDVAVMRVGVNRYDVLNRDELRAAFAFDRQMAGKSRRWPADATERR